MSDMEHMRTVWNEKINVEDGRWDIVTEVHGEPFFVASVMFHLPDDVTGERTAKAICDAHNAALDGAPMQRGGT